VVIQDKVGRSPRNVYISGTGVREHLNLVSLFNQVTKVDLRPVHQHFTYLGMRHPKRLEDVLDRLVPIWGYHDLGLSPVWRKKLDQVCVKEEVRLF
jgi:hypothetical protein